MDPLKGIERAFTTHIGPDAVERLMATVTPLPVILIAGQDPWYEKMISQIEQAKARGAPVIVVATDGDTMVPPLADHVLWVPKTPWLLSPVVNAIPLQLLAYHAATIRGQDVDKPRNLAKSVTVE